MSNYKKVEGKYAITNTNGIEVVDQAAKVLADSWKVVSEAAIYVAVHYATQEQVAVRANKGDTSLVSRLYDAVAEHHSGMQTPLEKFFLEVCGLKVFLKTPEKDGEELTISVEVEKETSRSDVAEKIHQKVDAFIANGGLASLKAKKRSRKEYKTGKKSSPTSEQPSEVVQVSAAEVSLENSGLADVFGSMTAGQSAALKEYSSELGQLVNLLSEAVSDPVKKNSAHQMLQTILNKLSSQPVDKLKEAAVA